MTTPTLMRTKTSLLMFLILLCLSTASHSKDPARVIAGWVEKVRIEHQDYDVKAKLDTGAKTSSIHATDIVPYKKDGKRWVKFTLLLKDSRGKLQKLALDKPRVRKAKIKNHDGVHDRRYVVDLALCFNGRQLNAEFTLADRNEYIYDVLLGRQLLKKIAIIDSNQTFLTAPFCNSTSVSSE